MTTAESHEIPKLLKLSNKSSVLELRCGSGGYAVHLAKGAGCGIVGLDINAEGVRNANVLAEQAKVGTRAGFYRPSTVPKLRAFANVRASASAVLICHGKIGLKAVP